MYHQLCGELWCDLFSTASILNYYTVQGDQSFVTVSYVKHDETTHKLLLLLNLKGFWNGISGSTIKIVKNDGAYQTML